MHSACPFFRRELAPRAPGSADSSHIAWCALTQRGEPSPTTGWQGLPAFNQAVQGMPLVTQPDAFAPGNRPRSEVRFALTCCAGGVWALASVQVLCSAVRAVLEASGPWPACKCYAARGGRCRTHSPRRKARPTTTGTNGASTPFEDSAAIQKEPFVATGVARHGSAADMGRSR